MTQVMNFMQDGSLISLLTEAESHKGFDITTKKEAPYANFGKKVLHQGDYLVVDSRKVKLSNIDVEELFRYALKHHVNVRVISQDDNDREQVQSRLEKFASQNSLSTESLKVLDISKGIEGIF